MTDSRSLQEIYQSASSSFEEVTKQLVQNYATALESALINYGEQETRAHGKVTHAIDSHEAEIVKAMNESLAAIKQSSEQAMVENEHFLTTLRDEVTLSCRSLQQEISDVTESLLRAHLNSTKVQQSRLTDRCDAEIEKLQQTSGKAKNSLREQGHSVGTKFGDTLIKRQMQQFLELMALEARVRDEVPNLLSNAASRSNNKEAEIRVLHKQQVEQMEGRMASAGEKITELTDAEMSRIGDRSVTADEGLRSFYKEVTEKTTQSMNKQAAETVSGLEDISKKHKDDVSAVYENLAKEIDKAVLHFEESERAHADQLVDKAAKLDEELKSLIEDQRLIAGQQSVVVAQILDELKEIEASFEHRMSGMLIKQLARIEEQRDSAVDEIAGTCKSVSAKITYLSGSFTQQIQDQENKVLKVVNGRLERAKQLIQDAAGEEG